MLTGVWKVSAMTMDEVSSNGNHDSLKGYLPPASIKLGTNHITLYHGVSATQASRLRRNKLPFLALYRLVQGNGIVQLTLWVSYSLLLHRTRIQQARTEGPRAP